MTHQDFSGKIIVITGASSGFGKGAALAFAGRGARLVLAARRENLLQEIARECGNGSIAVKTDVTRPEDIEKLAAAAVNAFGRIDVWINDAGAAAIGKFQDVPLRDHVKVIETDLLGPLYGSYAAFKQFLKQKSGTLINVASALGKVPAPYYASYNAAKHGVVGLSATLRQELEQNGYDDIHVCTVMPMAHDTPFFVHAANYSGHQVVTIPPTYDPQNVIDTLLDLVVNPKEETVVGNAGKLAALAHGLMPGIVDNMMAKETHKVQMEKAPPAPPSTGSLHEPMAAGTEITGGWKEKSAA